MKITINDPTASPVFGELDLLTAENLQVIFADLVDLSDPGEEWESEVRPEPGLTSRTVVLRVTRENDHSLVLTLHETAELRGIDLRLTKPLVLGGWRLSELRATSRTSSSVFEPDVDGRTIARRILAGLDAVEALSADASISFSATAGAHVLASKLLTPAGESRWLLRARGTEKSPISPVSRELAEVTVSEEVQGQISAAVRSAQHWSSGGALPPRETDFPDTDLAWQSATVVLRQLGRWKRWHQAADALASDEVPLTVANAALLWIAAELCDLGERDPRSLDRDSLAILRAAWERAAGAARVDAPIPSAGTLVDTSAILADLLIVAEWLSRQGKASAPLLLAALDISPEGPPHVAEARRRLQSLRSMDIVDFEMEERSLAALLRELIETLDLRALMILRGRVLSDEQTLEELGERNGVTRERIRQLEVKLKSTIRGWLNDPDSLRGHTESLRSAVGELAPLGAVLDDIPGLNDEIESVGMAAWDILDKLDDSVESDGRWIAAPSLASAMQVSEELLSEYASPNGALSVGATIALVERFPNLTDSPHVDAWMTHLGCTRVEGTWLLPRVKSLNDRLAVALELHDEPVTDDFAWREWFPELSSTYVRNVLGSDSRFARVDRELWGLREWGLTEYRSISDAIAAQLHANGPMPLTDLIESLTSRFDIAAASIVTYAAAYPFTTRRGTVSFAWRDPGVNRALSRSRNLYAAADEIIFRVTVNAEHLRGSGFTVPVALAARLGVSRGSTRAFSTHVPNWSFTASWRGGPQPRLGSIRTALLNSSAAIGDSCVLRFRDGAVTVSVLSSTDASDDELLRAWFGLGAEETLTWEAVGRALEMPEPILPGAVTELLRTRGEQDLIDVLSRIPGMRA